MRKSEQTAKGILKSHESFQKYTLTRYEPIGELSAHVKHYWIVKWDLRDQPPYRQVILSHPNVNMVFEEGHAAIYGVSRTTSLHLLKGRGAVFGVKFMPGGFYPFRRDPADELVEKSLPASNVFGEDIHEVAAILAKSLWEGDEAEMVELVDNLFIRRLPKPDPQGEFVNRVVEMIELNRELTRVDDVADLAGTSIRTLQRLFSRYIGVSPKWVIQRYRLLEAAEQMENGELSDWPHLALELGYYDQAHFIKDFKAIIGKSPVEFMKMMN